MQVCVRGQPDSRRLTELVPFFIFFIFICHGLLVHGGRSVPASVRQEPLPYRALQRQLQPLARACRRLHHLFFSFITPLPSTLLKARMNKKTNLPCVFSNH
jgi:hypothetical protein